MNRAAILEDPQISSFLNANSNVRPRVEAAVDWLLENHTDAPLERVITTMQRLLAPLRDNKVSFFFSYKKKDSHIAKKIASLLEEWSAQKLEMVHMESLGIKEIGHDWREWIRKKIPECQCFLLLMPNPGEDRDWTLYEAGFFSGGQTQHLAGRMICLHHADNEVADALGPNQSVPARQDSVEKFLIGLFHESDLIPGFPPINGCLDAKEKAKQIVELFQQPLGPCIHNCCAPHMVLSLEDPEEVTGWDALAKAQVQRANSACEGLFGFESGPKTLGEWIDPRETEGGWIPALVEGIKAALKNEKIPANSALLTLSDSGRKVRPIICGVHRHRDEAKRLAAVDLLFIDAEPGDDPAAASERSRLASLALTQHFAVRFRWEVLECFTGRALGTRDVLNFFRKLNALNRQTAQDTRLGDPEKVRADVRSFFTGDDLGKINRMFIRWDELSPRDRGGELDDAIADPGRMAGLIEEMLGLNQTFLELTSAHFAATFAG